MHALYGLKKSQSEKFLIDGTRIPVTEIEVSPCPVIRVKTMDKDGYVAVQIGIGTKKKPNKSLQGEIKGAKLEKAPHFLREVRMNADDVLPEVGESIKAEDVFKSGDIIAVTGVSKGKGFAGVVKRHHFKGGPRTHGQSDRERAPGSIGQTTTPGRVYKGKRMAGKMGNDTVTLGNLRVVELKENTLWIMGLVPGTRNGLLRIEKTGEDKKFASLQQVKEEIAVEVVASV